MNIRALYKISLGLGVGTVYTFICVLLAFRTGIAISASLVTPVIFYLLLKLFFDPTGQEVTLVQSIASGSSMAVFSLGTAYAAIVIYDPSNVDISFWELVGLGIGMNILGIIFACFLVDSYINKEELIFPKGKAVGEVINALTNLKANNDYRLIGSAIIALVVSSVVNIYERLLNPINEFFRTPKFVGIEISPMMFGLGMLLPFKTTALLMVGALYSLIIWFSDFKMSSSVSFKEFLFSPLVFYVSIGLVIGYTIYSIPKLFIKTFDSIFSISQDVNKGKKMLVFYALTTTIFLFALPYSMGFQYYLIIVSIVLALIVGAISARMRGETGFAATSLVYIIIPFIGIMNNNFTVVMMLSGAIILLSIATSYLLEMVKIGVVTTTNSNKIIKYYAFGTVFGTITGCISIMILQKSFGFGTSVLPCPASLIWGSFAQTFISGYGITGFYIFLLITATVIGFVATHLGFSSILIAIGIFVPISSVVPIFFGSLFVEITKRNKYELSPDKCGAGLIIGGGIVLMIKALSNLL